MEITNTLVEFKDVITIGLKVFLAGFGAVGLIEYLKNFIKTDKTIVFTILMPVIAVGCYCATELLPVAVIGSILTVGSVQLNYQILVQGFKRIVNSTLDKVSATEKIETQGEK